MGRPIKKKFFSARDGSADGNLQLICNVGSGAETKVIEAQVGTGKYRVDSGEQVKLVDKASVSLLEGEAVLELDGKRVRKLTQYLAYFFDGSAGVAWRDSDGNTIGTFAPALAPEGAPAPSQAILTVVTGLIGGGPNSEVTGVTITDPGAGYASAPIITFSESGNDDPATATCTIDGNGSIDSVTITYAGDYVPTDLPVTATVPAP